MITKRMKTVRNLLLMTALLLGGFAVQAQKMKLEIGMPYDKALEKLRAEKGIEIVSEVAGQEIEIVENQVGKSKVPQEVFYSYEFKDSKLAVITVNSTYEKQANAKKIYDEYVEMATDAGAEPLEYFDSEDYRRYIFVKSGKPGEVYGLHLKTLGKTAFQFRASVASCVDCPK